MIEEGSHDTQTTGEPWQLLADSLNPARGGRSPPVLPRHYEFRCHAS